MGRKACNPARQRTHQYDNAYGSQRRAARGRAPSSNVDKDECARHLGSLLALGPATARPTASTSKARGGDRVALASPAAALPIRPLLER